MPSYMSCWESEYLWEANAAFYGNEDNYIIYPFFKKENRLPFIDIENTFDIISPEYYCGILNKSANKKMKDFLDVFHSWCIENNIITEFSKLHPFIPSLLPTIKLYNIVWLNLTNKLNFEKRCRNAITRAKKENIEVYCSDKKSDLKDFHLLYTKTMKRLNASEKYFNPKQLFNNFISMMKNNSMLYVAKHDNKMIAAALFFHGYGFFHYFRACSDNDYLWMNPNNLVLSEAIDWAKNNGYKTFILGGGNPGQSHDMNDSLFKFKASFSKKTMPVFGYTKIHNDKLYKIFCEKKANYSAINNLTNNNKYFPEYQLKHFPDYRI